MKCLTVTVTRDISVIDVSVDTFNVSTVTRDISMTVIDVSTVDT